MLTTRLSAVSGYFLLLLSFLFARKNMAPRSVMMVARLALAVLLTVSSLVEATCYWQNSTLAPDDPFSIAPDDTACFPAQENSACCATGWTCLSDGVCYIEQGDNSFYYRGTCTDRTWNSQQCPGWCFAQSEILSALAVGPQLC